MEEKETKSTSILDKVRNNVLLCIKNSILVPKGSGLDLAFNRVVNDSVENAQAKLNESEDLKTVLEDLAKEVSGGIHEVMQPGIGFFVTERELKQVADDIRGAVGKVMSEEKKKSAQNKGDATKDNKTEDRSSEDKKKPEQQRSTKAKDELDMQPYEIKDEDCVKRLQEKGIKAEQFKEPETRLLFELYEKNMNLKQENSKLRADYKKDIEQRGEISEKNGKLVAENTELRAENTELNSEHESLNNENSKANRTKEDLEKQNDKLSFENTMEETKYASSEYFSKQMQQEYESLLASYNSLLKETYTLEGKCKDATKHIENLAKKLEQENKKGLFSRLFGKKAEIPQFVASVEDTAKLSEFLEANGIASFEDTKKMVYEQFNENYVDMQDRSDFEYSSVQIENSKNEKKDDIGENREDTAENRENEDIEFDKEYDSISGGTAIFNYGKYTICRNKIMTDMDTELSNLQGMLKEYHEQGAKPEDFGKGTSSEQMFMLYEQNIEIEQENNELKARDAELGAGNIGLSGQNMVLGKDNENLRSENEALRSENAKLEQENNALNKEVEQLTEENKKLSSRNSNLVSRNARNEQFFEQIKANYEELIARYNELREQKDVLKAQYMSDTRHIGMLTSELENTNNRGIWDKITGKKAEVKMLPEGAIVAEQSRGLRDIKQIREFDEIKNSSHEEFMNSRIAVRNIDDRTNEEIENDNMER